MDNLLLLEYPRANVMGSRLKNLSLPLFVSGLASILLVSGGCSAQVGSTPSATSDQPPSEEQSSNTSHQVRQFSSLEGNVTHLLSGQQKGIWATGIGKVSAEPDLAVLKLEIETRSITLSDAHSQARDAMNAVMTSLKQNAISDKDIQTNHFNIQPEYRYDDRARKQVFIGYKMSHSVTVKVRDLPAAGNVIDAAVLAGGDATRVQGIQLTIDDASDLKTMARENAIKDALTKAQQFATLTNVNLGRLTYIAETTNSSPLIPVYRSFAGIADSALEQSTPISPGELAIQVSVQAIFAIE
jgi:uncharacterized protein YggE